MGALAFLSPPKTYGQRPADAEGGMVAAPALPSSAPQETDGSPPAPNPYVGDLLLRSRLSGDWHGLRSALAEKGLTFDMFATQFYQGVVSGGQERRWEYGGKLDYLANLDSSKLGRWQGLFVTMHAETRYGNTVNNIDGLIAPANFIMDFPARNRNITAITGLKITQALSENLAVFAGKINSADEYPPITTGFYNADLGLNRPGLGAFMNTNFVINPIKFPTVSYSTAAVGGYILRGGKPAISFYLFDPEERSTRGLENLYGRGVTILGDLILRPRLFGRPGTYEFGGTYGTAKYQRPNSRLGTGPIRAYPFRQP
jgi:porin